GARAAVGAGGVPGLAGGGARGLGGVARGAALGPVGRPAAGAVARAPELRAARLRADGAAVAALGGVRAAAGGGRNSARRSVVVTDRRGRGESWVPTACRRSKSPPGMRRASAASTRCIAASSRSCGRRR